MDKVAVFLDYENVHRTGHQIFAEIGESIHETVVDPLLIAERLVMKRSRGGMLGAVHVFRGRPVPEFQPRPASANDIQAQAWESDERVKVHRRDLKYDRNDDGGFTAREKGIDVSMAIGIVEGALDQDFNVAIVFSCDTDIAPALELVYARRLVHLELAAWSGSKPLWFPEFLRQDPPKRIPYCHFLDDNDFVRARDFSAADA